MGEGEGRGRSKRRERGQKASPCNLNKIRHKDKVHSPTAEFLWVFLPGQVEIQCYSSIQSNPKVVIHDYRVGFEDGLFWCILTKCHIPSVEVEGGGREEWREGEWRTQEGGSIKREERELYSLLFKLPSSLWSVVALVEYYSGALRTGPTASEAILWQSLNQCYDK